MSTANENSRQIEARYTTLLAIAFILLALLPLCSSARAQEVDISGYYEHTLQANYSSRTSELLLDASKLRLDFSSGGDLIQFTGNVNLIVYHGAIELDVTPYLPESVARQLTLAGFPVVYRLPGDRTFLDNAYLNLEKGNIRFRAGKQQLSWGPAYSFNPTDLFHRKNILDPTYEKEGVSALRLDYRWGIGGQLTLVAAPGDELGDTGYAVRLGTHISAIGYDVAATAHAVIDSTAMDPATWIPYTQRRRAAGLELSGSLFGLGVWLEGNYNWVEIEEDFSRIAVGADYTLTSGLYLMVEALHNGRAESDTPYPVHDWLANLAYGEPVGSLWVLAGLRKDLSDLSAGGLYLFASDDGSMIINPRVDISIAQNSELQVFAGITAGNEEGAFPEGQTSLFARMIVYF
jgi:hypothetical protein